MVVAFGPLFAPVFAAARFFGATVVASATAGKILGLAFPRHVVQRSSRTLRDSKLLVAAAEKFSEY